MANIIQVKRSAVAARVPTTGDLALGEIGINTYDGKMYIKKNDGTATVVQIGLGTVTYTGTETLSNKRIQDRVVVIADGASIAIDSDVTDLATQANTQGAGPLAISAPTGTPTEGQKLMLRLSSTSVQTFAWNVAFQGSTDLALPTVSSSGGKYDYTGFIWNSTNSKWQLLATNFGF